jgi:hypothetical protein
MAAGFGGRVAGCARPAGMFGRIGVSAGVRLGINCISIPAACGWAAGIVGEIFNFGDY